VEGGPEEQEGNGTVGEARGARAHLPGSALRQARAGRGRGPYERLMADRHASARIFPSRETVMLSASSRGFARRLTLGSGQGELKGKTPGSQIPRYARSMWGSWRSALVFPSRTILPFSST
jgi:hypothetical protein